MAFHVEGNEARANAGDQVDMVGARIRTLRQQRGLTLRTLASSTGLSIGLISQVERGLVNPSLETLRRVARVLDVPIFDLFGDVRDAPAAVIRESSRMLIRSPQGGVAYSRISPGSGKVEMLEGRLEPGGASSAEPWAHPSEECILVLTGRVVVEVASERYVLASGDSCYFDSRLPHRYVNETSRRVRYILGVTPPSY